MNHEVQQQDVDVESWKHFEELFDTLREPLILLSPKLRVLRANRAFHVFFRVSNTATEQQFIYDLREGQWNIPALRNLLEETLSQNTTLEDYELTHSFGEIGVRTLLINARRLAKLDCILLAMEDVTERFRYRKELERSNKALSSVVAIASHDLREPIRTISSFLILIENEVRAVASDTLLKNLAFCINGAKRMMDLVNALCIHASIGSERKNELVDLNKVYLQTLDNLQSNISESGTRIHKTQLPVIPGCPSELLQLFQNLFNNAIKYNAKLEPEIWINAERKNRDWIISIKDNGIGIPASQLKRIFDVFTRLNSNQTSGSGIGLATCKKIVEEHGGEIWVESVLDQGSTFYFRLPAE